MGPYFDVPEIGLTPPTNVIAKFALTSGALQQMSEPGSPPGSLERRVKVKKKGCMISSVYHGLTK